MSNLIRDRKGMQQIIDFSGLKESKIYPSDVDAVIEIDREYLFLIEVKHKGGSIPVGQKLMLERLADKWNPLKSFVLHVEHDTKNYEDVDLANCKLIKYYHSCIWVDMTSYEITTKEAIKRIARGFNIKKLL